jgi:hypothetical protein
LGTADPEDFDIKAEPEAQSAEIEAAGKRGYLLPPFKA